MLIGCAVPTPAPSTPPGLWRGRFSVHWLVQREGEARSEQASGRFVLEVDANRTRLEVISPLGQVMAIASLGPEGASLQTADGRRHEAPQAEQLLIQVLGWPAPVERLARWLMLPAVCTEPAGVRTPPSPVTAADAVATAPSLRFQDSGWHVAVESWESSLPKRLQLHWQAGGPAERGPRSLSMRLIVDERGGEPPAPSPCPAEPRRSGPRDAPGSRA